MHIDERWHGDIDTAIHEIIVLSRQMSEPVQFDFNGVTLLVNGDSDPSLIHRDWSRGMNGYLGKNPTVGPYPSVVLSDDDIKNDAVIEAANERRREAADKAYAAKQLAEQQFLRGVLLMAGPIELANPDGWGQFVANNTDPYGAAAVRYAETWARVMQVRMAAGCTLEETASEASHVADTEGITGFMYGCAVSMLSQCWIHGEQLRRWHNKDSQIGTEGDEANESGGVLNPALLRIG